MHWTEAAFGGTVGLPDAALVNSEGNRFELELKVWDEDSKGWVVRIRPAQIHYHLTTMNDSRLLIGIKGEVGKVYLSKLTQPYFGTRSPLIREMATEVETWDDLEKALLLRQWRQKGKNLPWDRKPKDRQP